jgi:chemotaxis protein MotB
MDKARENIIIIRKKKVHGHGHHGGAWKVAFADFMTAMFALFLVLWLVNQSSDVKSAVAGYFQHPLGTGDEFGSSIVPGDGAQAALTRPLARPDPTDLRVAQFRQIGEEIRERMRRAAEFRALADHVEITVTAEGLKIELVEDSTGVFFESGNAMPRSNAASLFAMLGHELSALPNQVVVDGHTDAAPYVVARGYSNWELSADRANTTRRILIAGGLRSTQILEVRGHADRQLKHPEAPTSPRNRRVTITMLFGDELATDTLAARLPRDTAAAAPAPATAVDTAATAGPGSAPTPPAAAASLPEHP